MMKLHIQYICCFFILTAYSCVPAFNKVNPNVILILADDMGWGDIHANGNLLIETPVLDKLFEVSLVFDRFYVCPLCAPTRSEILTGRYFLKTGVASVSQGYENMAPEEKTIAEYFKEGGYSTGCFGKWHNGAYFPQHPNRKGFDEFVGFTNGHLGYYFDAIYTHNDTLIQSEGYSTDYFTKKAIQFIESNKETPFFCYIPYNVPHSPFQVPEKYFNKYKEKGLDNRLACIYGMIENMDENIGTIIRKLEELKLSENTVLIFLSDNGPNGDRYNGNMKGTKSTVDEGGVRVPFYICWPGAIEPGTTFQLVHDIDLLPTILSLASVSYQPKLQLDGIDLSRYILTNKESTDRSILSRQAKMPIEQNKGAIRNNQFRLVLSSEDTLLYDMQNDPSQKKNISAEFPLATRKLVEEYKMWEEKLVGNYQHHRTILAGFSNEKHISLPVQDASLSGHVRFSSIYPNQAYTHNWIQKGDSIYWEMEIQQAGSYEVELQYGCPDSIVGSGFLLYSSVDSISFHINKGFDSVVLPDRDYVERAESVERTWAWLNAGRISLAAGKENIVLKLSDIKKSDAGLIKGIKLNRISL